MKTDKVDAKTHLNNKPSDKSEGLKTQIGDQLQALPHQENTIHNPGTALVTLRFPSSPNASDEFFWTEEVNSVQHKIRQLLCFKPLPGMETYPFYFDVVKSLETGLLRIRLDSYLALCWRDLERLDCESISAAIVSLMKEHYLNAIMLNEHSVVNCCPDILNKSKVAEIINAGLQNSSQAGFITLPEFMEKRYEEDESEYCNEQIYNRGF